MRLAFSVAAHLEPEILAIDEVLAVGDAAFQKKCLGKMGKFAKEGRTVLFVSHNMIAVKSLCRRAIWLDEGRVKDDGDADHIVSKYLKSNASSKTVQVWNDIETAPGNEIVRLHRVCVRGENHSRPDLITMQTPFRIEVEFWNMAPGARLHINLHLVTEEQIIAFSTSNADESGWWTDSLPVGLFRGVCYIPADFLNSGLHNVTLLVVKDQSKVVYRNEDVLSVDVLDLSERSEGWFGKGSGVVSPLLNWTMERIGGEP
jgi:lipopolysaccharide transport system ATP-binding protein